MEGLTWFVLGGAVGLSARRVVPVTKALVAAGSGIAKATLSGMQAIGYAAVTGKRQTAGTATSSPAEELTAIKVSTRPARTRRTAKTA